jgi:thioredoxin-related protein
VKTIMLSVTISLLLSMGCNISAQAAEQAQFKELQNLQDLAMQSKQQQLPILIMFGAEWCEFCQLLNERIFTPMALNGLYEGKVVLMRHAGVDEAQSIPDWNGQLINKSNWAYELDADLTPTVLFFDGEGKEVAPRIIGISEITLYAGIIHQNLNIAYRNMGLDRQIPITPELLYIQSKQAQKN